MAEELDDLQPKKREVSMDDLVRWKELKTQLADIKEKEMALRKEIFGHYFPEAKEGTNTAPLAQGWVLKGGRVVDRKVDIGAATVMSEDGGLFAQNGIDPDTLIDWKPELNIKAYRALAPEKRTVFEQCLIIKDGAPSLDITLPAAARKAKGD